jgi:hypothetical protein
MLRAVVISVAAVVGAVGVLAGCAGGGGGAVPGATASACPLLAQLAQTGKTVADADVSDPATFDATLRTAVTEYVRIAHRLRLALPNRLRPDVDRLTAAAQQYRFGDATAARAEIDAYARTTCAST